MFQSFSWNLAAACAFRSEPPYVVAVEGGNGAAILPACVAEGNISFLGDSLFDYRDLLADSSDATAAAWTRLAALRLPLSLTALYGARSQAHWRDMGFVPTPFVTAPGVRVADLNAIDFESRHHRSLRLLRRLNRLGVSFHEHSGRDSALLRAIYQAKAAQVLESGENLFTDPARRDFLIAAGGLGACDVFTFESAGTLVAALVTFRDGEVRRFYTIYYDRAWAHYSPGVALLFEVTRRTLASGLDCDYMTGEQPHKVRFATSSQPLFRVLADAEELAGAGNARVAAA
jgi:CelD/BcsL family acetyltransferase involved in cellulose biosynthesis